MTTPAITPAVNPNPKWAVQAPDGKVIQFPDSFSADDVNREMTKMYGQPDPTTPQGRAAILQQSGITGVTDPGAPRTPLMKEDQDFSNLMDQPAWQNAAGVPVPMGVSNRVKQEGEANAAREVGKQLPFLALGQGAELAGEALPQSLPFLAKLAARLGLQGGANAAASAITGGNAKDVERSAEIGAGGEALSTALPFLAPGLKKAAQTQYVRALAPTTKANKTIAQDIAPEMMQRGINGSLESMENQAQSNASQLRPELTNEYQQLEQSSPVLPTRGPQGRMQAGTTGQIPNAGTQIVKDLDSLKGQYIVDGKVAEPAAIDAINGVQDVVKQYGPNISPTSLRQLKQIFDEPVAAANGYAGTDISTHFALNAKEAAANSIRSILHSADPDLAGLDKEISFWLDVQRVTGQSALRRTGQEGGLLKTLTPLAGAVGLGFGAAGHSPEVGVGSAAATVLSGYAAQAVRSPAWRTASALVKDRFASALAAGDVGQVTSLMGRFAAANSGRSTSRQQSGPQTPSGPQSQAPQQ